AGADGKGVCPCCDLAVLPAADGGLFVAFRNAAGGNRDVYVTRSLPGGRFGEPVCVTDGHWPFEGCPHDGPALALCGGRLQVAWMDAHGGKRRVYLASSSPDALHFTGRELCPEVPGEQGHPKVAAAGDVLHVVWDNSVGEAAPAAS